DDLGGTALGLDLLLGRLGKVVRLDRQFLAQLAGTQNTYTIGGSLGKTGFRQGRLVHGVPVGEAGVEVADVDDEERLGPGGVGEAALGDAAEERHLAALEVELRVAGAGAAPLALVAAA